MAFAASSDELRECAAKENCEKKATKTPEERDGGERQSVKPTKIPLTPGVGAGEIEGDGEREASVNTAYQAKSRFDEGLLRKSTSPRDYSFTSESHAAKAAFKEEAESAEEEAFEANAYEEKSDASKSAKKETKGNLLNELFKSSFTLEELLFVGIALFLASGEADDEMLLLFTLAFLLLSR